MNNKKLARALNKALTKAAEDIKEPGFSNRARNHYGDYDHDYKHTAVWPRTSDSAEPGDELGYEVKPEGESWDAPPVTEAEKAIYYGLHIHSQSNPTGLHTHMKGGKLGGAHTHGPANRLGGHTHKDISFKKDGRWPRGYSLDGQHMHDYKANMPAGSHVHCVENFG
jgi:hypothetical protein